MLAKIEERNASGINAAPDTVKSALESADARLCNQAKNLDVHAALHLVATAFAHTSNAYAALQQDAAKFRSASRGSKRSRP